MGTLGQLRSLLADAERREVGELHEEEVAGSTRARLNSRPRLFATAT
jgi:hypothetical protein